MMSSADDEVWKARRRPSLLEQYIPASRSLRRLGV